MTDGPFREQPYAEPSPASVRKRFERVDGTYEIGPDYVHVARAWTWPSGWALVVVAVASVMWLLGSGTWRLLGDHVWLSPIMALVPLMTFAFGAHRIGGNTGELPRTVTATRRGILVDKTWVDREQIIGVELVRHQRRHRGYSHRGWSDPHTTSRFGIDIVTRGETFRLWLYTSRSPTGHDVNAVVHALRGLYGFAPPPASLLITKWQRRVAGRVDGAAPLD